MARTTLAHLFSSVNGVVESPNLFHFDSFGPEEAEAMGATIGPVTPDRELYHRMRARPPGTPVR